VKEIEHTFVLKYKQKRVWSKNAKKFGGKKIVEKLFHVVRWEGALFSFLFASINEESAPSRRTTRNNVFGFFTIFNFFVILPIKQLRDFNLAP